MKTLIKIIIVLVVLCSLVILPFISEVLLNNWKLQKMTKEFLYSEFEEKALPGNTVVLGKFDKIFGPWSSNYCAPFTGVLLQTALSYDEIMNYYPKRDVAWIQENLVTLYNEADSEIIYPYDCHTCFPEGIKELKETYAFAQLPDNTRYMVVFETDYYTSSFDIRCH